MCTSFTIDIATDFLAHAAVLHHDALLKHYLYKPVKEPVGSDATCEGGVSSLSP